MTNKEKLKVLDILKNRIILTKDSCGDWFIIDNVKMTKKRRTTDKGMAKGLNYECIDL